MGVRWAAAPACLAALAAAGSITAQERQDILALHNVYRCMHAVPAFTWDAAIAAKAQAWADNGQYMHSSSSSRVVGGEPLGENLAWGSPSRTGVDSTRAWYSEISFTVPYGTADNMTDAVPANEAIGHYTQVVWNTSVKLGCGKGTATVSGSSGDYWVCQYGPAGNWVGQFATHVPAPSKSVGECSGVAADVPATTTPAPAGGPAALPSACFPSVPLPHGGLCVYGYQCASKFCCPQLKVCLRDSSASVGTDQIKVKADQRQSIIDIVFRGTCSNSFGANGAKCMQTPDGQPLSTWDQTVCGCHADYMTRYQAGTWVTLNDIDGLTCTQTRPAAYASGAAPCAPGAAWPPALLAAGLLALLHA